MCIRDSRTADSGYLTRRLVDVSQELIVREIDCAGEGEEIPGMYVHAFIDVYKRQLFSLWKNVSN